MQTIYCYALVHAQATTRKAPSSDDASGHKASTAHNPHRVHALSTLTQRAADATRAQQPEAGAPHATARAAAAPPSSAQLHTVRLNPASGGMNIAVSRRTRQGK